MPTVVLLNCPSNYKGGGTKSVYVSNASRTVKTYLLWVPMAEPPLPPRLESRATTHVLPLLSQ
jgi:hypothetical protein